MVSQTPYRPALVTYVDLLGFKNLISIEDAASVKKILTRFQTYATDDYVNAYAERYAEPIFESAVLSDSIIRVNYLDHLAHFERPFGVVFNEILAMNHAMIELMPLGIFPRGGIAAGDMYVDSEHSQFFGPALVHAVTMEEKVGHPCIAVSNDVLEIVSLPSVKAVQNTAEQETEYVGNLLSDVCVTAAGEECRFIDPFKTFECEADYPPEWLEAVREVLVSRRKEFEGNKEVLPKYEWLIGQFNSCVSSFDEEQVQIQMGMTKQELLID